MSKIKSVDRGALRLRSWDGLSCIWEAIAPLHCVLFLVHMHCFSLQLPTSDSV
ncbi:MAG: hypothetical protein PUP92_23470 [Rhizonema sp. PD38]|nr:hypothetical protein [Rhizonema sp. PD38]